jgi:aspartokinase
LTRVVMKFGGSLIASYYGMKRAGDLVERTRGEGDEVVVVVSSKLKLPRAACVVCIATGNGLKDLSDHGGDQKIEPATDVDSIANSIGGS